MKQPRCPRCNSAGFQITNNYHTKEEHCVMCGFIHQEPGHRQSRDKQMQPHPPREVFNA